MLTTLIFEFAALFFGFFLLVFAGFWALEWWHRWRRQGRHCAGHEEGGDGYHR